MGPCGRAQSSPGHLPRAKPLTCLCPDCASGERADNLNEALNAQIWARRALEQDVMILEVPGAGNERPLTHGLPPGQALPPPAHQGAENGGPTEQQGEGNSAQQTTGLGGWRTTLSAPSSQSAGSGAQGAVRNLNGGIPQHQESPLYNRLAPPPPAHESAAEGGGIPR